MYVPPNILLCTFNYQIFKKNASFFFILLFEMKRDTMNKFAAQATKTSKVYYSSVISINIRIGANNSLFFYNFLSI